MTTFSTAVLVVYTMPPIDVFDYLADYTDNEPRTAAELKPAAMRAALLADIKRTGHAVFLRRVAATAAEFSRKYLCGNLPMDRATSTP